MTCRVPGCKKCNLRRPFDFPPDIIDAYKAGNLVFFAGAGVSTENRGVYRNSFYEEISERLDISDEDKLSFSELMTLFVASTKSRKDLFLAIKKRFDYVRSFPELYACATEFHREIATIPRMNDIFTTNWDDFFERECDATPVVTGEDFVVFHDIPGRKVFKIHGSIGNYGSIVASNDDYDECYKRLSEGIIGANLKLFLVSKTVVFIGYSLGDEDFLRIYRLLLEETKGMLPRSYIVTLDEKAQDKIDSIGMNTIPIITDSVYFVEQMKKRLVEEKLMLPDSYFEDIPRALLMVKEEHRKLSTLSMIEHPNIMYSLVYQDGLQHAFGRIISKMNSGEYSDGMRVINGIKSYEVLIKDCLSAGNYLDVAYFTGYQSGMFYFIDIEARDGLPFYFLFKCGDILNFEQFLECEKESYSLHKSASKLAKKWLVELVQVNYNIIVDHGSYLF